MDAYRRQATAIWKTDKTHLSRWNQDKEFAAREQFNKPGCIFIRALSALRDPKKNAGPESRSTISPST